jgi:hypothetical protein
VDKNRNLAEEVKKKDEGFDKLMQEYDKDIQKLKDSILKSKEER